MSVLRATVMPGHHALFMQNYPQCPGFLVHHQSRQDSAVGWENLHFRRSDLSPHQHVQWGKHGIANYRTKVLVVLSHRSSGRNTGLSMQVQLKFINFFLFRFLVFQKKQNSSTKCRPRGEKLFSERISFGIRRKYLGRGGTENLDMEVAGSSMRSCMQHLPFFSFPNLLKSLRFYAVPEWISLWYVCGWFHILWQLHHSSDS